MVSSTRNSLMLATLCLASFASPSVGVSYPSFGLPTSGFGAVPSTGFAAGSNSKAYFQNDLHGVSGGVSPLQEVFQYRNLEYNIPIGAQLDNGAYDPSRNVFTGLEITRDRIFLAVPRLYPGVPSTISYVQRAAAGFVPNPPLEPFPGWEWQSPNGIGGYGANCSGFVSVYRIRADRCNRLWVLDSGLTNSLAGYTPVCTPKLVAFDLSTDQAVRRITFPRAALRPSSLLTNLVIDDEGPIADPRCERLVFYLSDTAVPGLVVYDSGRDLVRRVTDLSMYPDPDFGTYTIAGESFSLMDGVIGLALSPANYGGGRTLYYQPLATNKVFSVPTSALRDFNADESQELPVTLVGRKSSAGAGLAMDDQGSLFFSPVEESAIATYSPTTGKQSIIVVDTDRLQFAAELRIDNADGSLWLLSTRFQKYFRNTVNLKEVNLRVIRIPREALYGRSGLSPLNNQEGLYHNFYKRSTNSTALFG